MFLRSGDLLCVNCLKAVQKNDCEVAFEPAEPSSLSQEDAFEPAGPSSLSQEVAFEPAGPSSLSQEVSFEPAGPSCLSQECAVPTPYSSTQDSDSSSDDLPGSPALRKINETLSSQEVSPFRKRYIHSQRYVAEKSRRLMEAVEENIQLATGARPEAVHTDDDAEILQQLKEKFALTKSRSEMIRILTVLPKSWLAKKIVKDKGVMSSPNSKAATQLSGATVILVKTFYYHDDISRVMPGKKDFLSVRNAEGEKEHKQKRLVLCNLKEAYHQFKQQHPDIKVGFSKFAELRPKECVLAGATGTHSVCVCTIHQNVKLMMAGGRLEALTNGWFSHYKDCLAAIQCEPPHYNCAVGKCTECPGPDALREELEDAMEENGVETVQYNQWTNTDRANLETRIVPVEEFLDVFMAALKKLQLHDFIAKHQAKFLAQKKENLTHGEFLVIADFSENYSFVVQDEVQSFHWNNLQATVHPFLCYYRNTDGKLGSACFTIISENKEHDTIAVHLFQRKLVSFLTEHFGSKPKIIIYMSDGCAGQYKNCYNFSNLCHHVEDFGVPAEWHFFATSHGKSPADGIAGTVKRTAAKASLQRPFEDQILTPLKLYEFVLQNIKGIHFAYSTLKDHEQEAKILAERFKYCRTVPGTRSFHSFIPLSTSSVNVMPFSLGTMKITERVTSAHITEEALPLSMLKGYVTVAYEGSCWLGYVIKVDVNARLVEVNFLHPKLPAQSFIFPQHQDILEVDPTDIVTLVYPSTATGRTYFLTQKEIATAIKTHEARMSQE
ncbi:hypothetical protein EMCRGX_G001083 [Ephydatia muelleri]